MHDLLRKKKKISGSFLRRFLEIFIDWMGMDEGRRHEDSLVLNSSRHNASRFPRYLCTYLSRGQLSSLRMHKYDSTWRNIVSWPRSITFSFVKSCSEVSWCASTRHSYSSSFQFTNYYPFHSLCSIEHIWVDGGVRGYLSLDAQREE